MQSDGATLGQTIHHYAMMWVLVTVYFVLAYCLERWVTRPRYRRMEQREAAEPGSLMRAEMARNATDTAAG